MSQRKQDGTEELLGCLGMLLFGAIAAPIAYLFQSQQKPPEVQLRELDLPTAWGVRIPAITCGQCQTVNDQEEEICSHCGAVLPSTHTPKPKQSETSLATVIIIIVALLCLLCLFESVMSLGFTR